MIRAALFTLGLAVVPASTASAAVVFADDFSSYGSSTALNASDSLFGGAWATTGGTVDYLAPPPASFSELCRGFGSCIDLDGSTGDAGVFSTIQSFAAGTYALTIQLFGSLRGSTESVTISMGDWSTTIAGIASGADASGVFNFTTTGGVLSFANAGGDNVGAILSNVSLASTDVAPVPLPAGGLLLLAGLGGLAALRRRKGA